MTTTIDRRIVPYGRLATDARGMAHGRPVIVIGGGPSAPRQYASLPEHVRKDALIVAANDHAFRLTDRVYAIVCKDHKHTETGEFMEDRVRRYGVPVYSHHHWADFRMARWPSQGNSGQLAIALAAFLGGAPVIPVGIDCYQKGTYFHDFDAKNVSTGRTEALWRSSSTRLMARLEGACIRPVDGILTRTFKRYDPMERVVPKIPTIFDGYGGNPTYYVRAVKPFFLFTGSRIEVPVGWVLPVIRLEYEQFLRLGVAAPVDRTQLP